VSAKTLTFNSVDTTVLIFHNIDTTQVLSHSRMSAVRKYAGLPDLVCPGQVNKREAKAYPNRILLPISMKLLNSQTIILHIM